jgi:hypothetical protein
MTLLEIVVGVGLLGAGLSSFIADENPSPNGAAPWIKAGYGGEGETHWHGRNELLNPLHAKRWIWAYSGAILIVFHLFMQWTFSNTVGRSGAALVGGYTAPLLLWPGLLLLGCVFWFCRKFIKRQWTLTAKDGWLRYESNTPGEIVKGALLTAWILVSGGFKFSAFDKPGVDMKFKMLTRDQWTVRLCDVTRIETGQTAQWAPARPGVFGDRPVSPDEIQAFILLPDGRRVVIASVHAGREECLRLAQSIRAFVEHQRQAERVVSMERSFVAASGVSEGFSI